MFPLNIWWNNWCILTKFGTQKHQGKTKTKFELGDLDYNFEVTGHLRRWDMKDGFCWSAEEIFDISSTKFGTQKHQGLIKTKFEPGDLDLVFEVTDVILRWRHDVFWRTVWCILTKFGAQKHQSSRRPSSNRVNMTSFLRSQKSFKVIWYERWFCWISEEIFYVSSPNLVPTSTVQDEDQVWTGWPWPHFRGHRGH